MGYKRNLRQVLDAGYDLTGAEQDNSSNFVGFTTQLVNILTNTYGFSAANCLINYDQLAKDSGNNYPVQDGILVSGGGATYASSHINVGLKHYHQQMQAMKGPVINLGTDDSASSPSNAAITGTGNGNGTYKTTNISMGGMRGFEYSTSNNGLWPSSAGTVETLYDTGEISVGSTS